MIGKRAFVALACLLMTLGMIGLSYATSYNATTEFSITNGNPNGVWTYGWMDSGFTTFTPYTDTVIGAFKQWYVPGHSGDYTPNVGYNYTAGVEYGVLPGQITLHPGPNGEVTVLRFMAPSTDQYSIVGQFFAGDVGIMQVGVREGSTWLWQAQDYGVFSLSENLSAGQTVDFVVYGGYGYGNTPLELTIATRGAAVPEPATALLLVAGLAGLRCIRRFKR